MRQWRVAVAVNRRTRWLLSRWLRRTTHGAMKRAWLKWVEATTVRGSLLRTRWMGLAGS